jgi:hypothetical protein
MAGSARWQARMGFLGAGGAPAAHSEG